MSLVYLADILIFSNESHKKHVEQVVQRLREYNQDQTIQMQIRTFKARIFKPHYRKSSTAVVSEAKRP
jgi:CRISPR/Cas system-associated protein Csx1